MKKQKWIFFAKEVKKGWAMGIERNHSYQKPPRNLQEIIRSTLAKKMPTS